VTVRAHLRERPGAPGPVLLVAAPDHHAALSLLVPGVAVDPVQLAVRSGVDERADRLRVEQQRRAVGNRPWRRCACRSLSPRVFVLIDVALLLVLIGTVQASTAVLKTGGYFVLVFAALGPYLFASAASQATGENALPLGKPTMRS
jgi:GPR1/FUN34/yaaH family